MGTLLAGYPLGIGLGFVLLPLARSWRVAMAWTAALASAAVIAVATALPRSPGSAAEARRDIRLGTRVAVEVTVAGLVWGCSNAGFAVLLGFAPAFFVGQGASAQAAGALVSLLAFTTVPIGPLGGWLLGCLPRPLLGIAGGITLASLATLRRRAGIGESSG
jgi:cyanate permease